MPSVLPPLESLRILAACVRHESYSRAARELCLTPGAVSLRMRTLEARLGVKLFVRHGPRLAATEQGRLLAASVDAALATIHGALERCRRARRALRVTCAPAFARWLVPRLAAWHALPDAAPIALDASETLSTPDRFDVAIRSGTGSWRSASALELLPDRGTPMLSPALLGGKKPTLERLLKMALIPDRRWPRWFALAGVAGEAPAEAATRFASYELEAAAACEGVGAALLCPLLYGDLLASGKLVAPFATCVEGPNRYWALWPDAAPTPPFVEWLARELGRAPPDAGAQGRAPPRAPRRAKRAHG